MVMVFWTPGEEARLVQELRDGLTIEDIAAAHQRTPTAMVARTSRMTPQDLDPGSRTRDARTGWLRAQLRTDADYDWNAALAATRRREREQSRAKAPRKGTVWTAAEDEQVLAAIATGVSVPDLAAHLRRSAKSIARRIHHLNHRDDAPSAAVEPGSGTAHPRQESTVPPRRRTPARDPATATTGGPSAHGQPWTPEETSRLLQELRGGRPVADVATAHQRSVRAVHGRAAGALSDRTGRKHPLAEATTEQLRALLIQDTENTAATPSAP